MLYVVWFRNCETDPTGMCVEVYDNHFVTQWVRGVEIDDGYFDYRYEDPPETHYGFPSLASIFQLVSGKYGSFKYVKIIVDRKYRFSIEENPETVRAKVHEYDERREVCFSVEFQTLVGAIEYVEGELVCQE